MVQVCYRQVYFNEVHSPAKNDHQCCLYKVGPDRIHQGMSAKVSLRTNEKAFDRKILSKWQKQLFG